VVELERDDDLVLFSAARQACLRNDDRKAGRKILKIG